MKKILIIAILLFLPYLTFADTGLDFPGNGNVTVQFRFTGTNLVNAWPATYIWRVKPIQQTGFYTTFFWGHMATGYGDLEYNYYGAHPYPQTPGYTIHNWEIAANGGDNIIDENGHNTVVVMDHWYTQALVVTASGNDITMTFYWDLEAGADHVIQDVQTGYALNFPPTSPGLVFGDAPWNSTHEELKGILRGIQIYAGALSLTDIQTEAANNAVNTPQTSAGLASVFYMNQNPTPSDISDKSGKGHNPAWVGSGRPTLYTSEESPSAPKGFRITN